MTHPKLQGLPNLFHLEEVLGGCGSKIILGSVYVCVLQICLEKDLHISTRNLRKPSLSAAAALSVVM